MGAALSLTPNGVRVLSRLGFSLERARACKALQWDMMLGGSLKRVNSVDFSMAEKKFGACCWSVHRVDLHNELLRLATSTDTADSKPVILRLGAPVVDASTDGTLTLKDGSRHTADMIVAADGLHSVLRNVVLTDDTKAPSHSGLSSFRFLIDTKVLEDDTKFAQVLDARTRGFALIIDEKDKVNERHMVWYPCREWVTHRSAVLLTRLLSNSLAAKSKTLRAFIRHDQRTSQKKKRTVRRAFGLRPHFSEPAS